MSVGMRIYNQYPETDFDMVARLARIPVANMDDVMGRIYSADHSLKSMNGLPIAGAACTVKVAQGDNLGLHRALDICRPGDIIVVDGRGYTDRSLCGEQIYRYAMAKGIKGLVVYGAIRDLDGLQKLDFPVYACAAIPDGPYKNGPCEINVPICMGGVVVFPGDYIIGDEDGILVVRPQDAPEVAAAGEHLMEIEVEKFTALANGTPNKKWVMEKLQSMKYEILEKSYFAG